MASITTPQKRWVIWVGSNAALLAIIPTFWYWLQRVVEQELSTGVRTDTNSDSFGIPVLTVALYVLAALPVLNILLWWLLRRYPGRVGLLQRPSARGTRQLIDVLCLLGAASLLLLLINAAANGDWEFTILHAVWLYLVLAYRAILLTRSTPIAEARTHSVLR